MCKAIGPLTATFVCICSAATAIDFLQHCEIDGDLKYRNVLVSLFFCLLPVK